MAADLSPEYIAIPSPEPAPLTPDQVQVLLGELCRDLGFCPPPHVLTRLQNAPPADVIAFTDAVIAAEGFESDADISLHLVRDLRSRVASHFKRAEEQRQNQEAQQSL